jgi:hypothetical protein
MFPLTFLSYPELFGIYLKRLICSYERDEQVSNRIFYRQDLNTFINFLSCDEQKLRFKKLKKISGGHFFIENNLNINSSTILSKEVQFLSMSMTLRTRLANVHSSTWTGPSRHSFIVWARITQMRSYLSMGQISFAKTHIHTSNHTINKPRRRKKRYKDDTQATNQEITTEVFINNWMLKIKILNTKSMKLMLITPKKITLAAEKTFFFDV